MGGECNSGKPCLGSVHVGCADFPFLPQPPISKHQLCKPFAGPLQAGDKQTHDLLLLSVL
jgi:hypothetical protein